MYERADELRRLLNEWDLFGVFDAETNVDEYGCMLLPSLMRLAGGAGGSEIRECLGEEIRGHFGMSPEGVGTGPVAERLVASRLPGLPRSAAEQSRRTRRRPGSKPATAPCRPGAIDIGQALGRRQVSAAPSGGCAGGFANRPG
ncbi:hypothetical protein ABZX66_25770 [Micromonospora aurantiaca]|uniref:hypothetical protein n=1 Tax=Micromonospora aurantiaca (nom. illeg.) TaxID=47850 RepID=UPI0033B8992D